MVDVACHAMVFAGVRDSHIGPEAARLLPLAEPFVAALARAPDAAFVVVDAEGQHVKVEKRSGTFRIHVDSADGRRIDIGVPTRTVRHVLSAVARLANVH